MKPSRRAILPLAALALSVGLVGLASLGGGARQPSAPVALPTPAMVVTAPVAPSSAAVPALPATRPVVPQVYPAVRATGHELRVDLEWDVARSASVDGYHVYRAERSDGAFERLTPAPLELPLYSDFLDANEVQRWYRVAAVVGGQEILVGAADARSRAQDDQEFMTSVQRATFRYFWDFAHPHSGLVRERSSGNLDICATGGTGFGLFAIMVGVERGFVSRSAAVERVLKILDFYDTKAERYHGAFAHWLDGRTGKTVPFSTFDDGGDIVETSFLVQGMLALRQYFNRNDPQEIALRQTATRLWEGVEWNWYLRSPESRTLYWHWSPNYGWAMDLKVGGGFNETMITYLLAMSSPTHPIPESCYHDGWVGDGTTYVNGSDYYGYTQWVGETQGGPLFFTHYSFIGLDPRGLKDRYCDYFQNNRNISLINRSYCIENPGRFPHYGEHVWGLTASDGPDGYFAHAPGLDNGTIAPTASISAMPYIPAESLATMRHLYRTYGAKLWGVFGFKDSFNPGRDWYATDHLAIDQGPIICMIENHRTGLCWEQFMKNTEIHGAIARIAVKPAANDGMVAETPSP